MRVTNEMKCEMNDDHFVFYDHNDPECDTIATPLRNTNFSEWFKINAYTGCHATLERHFRQ